MAEKPIAGVDLEAEQIIEEEAEKPVSAGRRKSRPWLLILGGVMVVEAVIVEIVLVKSVLVEFILVEFVFFDDFVVRHVIPGFGGLRRIIDTRSSCATLWLAKPTVTGATGSPVPGILPESRWPIADGCRRQWGGQAPVWPRRFSSARRSASSRPSVGSAEWSTNVIASATA